jgi:transposase-like protein
MKEDEKAASAVDFLKAAVAYYRSLGVTVARFMTDNGACYKAFTFRDACRDLGLKHICTKPYIPKTNGKAERFIQTALRESAYARPYDRPPDYTAAEVVVQLQLASAPRRHPRQNSHQQTRSIRRQPVEASQSGAISSPIESSRDSRIGEVLFHALCRRRGLAHMARSLSVDLRRRVVDAIEGGLSCRAAAQRFGVSASSAIRWRGMERRDIRPKLQGGARHSQRIEAHAEVILSAVAAKSDMTLAECASG